MASASSSSARLLFSDSKRTLGERINVNAHNATAVARQVVRGSKSKEMLMSSAKGLAHAESAMDGTLKQLTTIELIQTHIGVQLQSIDEGTQKIAIVGEQVQLLLDRHRPQAALSPSTPLALPLADQPPPSDADQIEQPA